MKSEIVERYIYDVMQRLPEKELRSYMYDMILEETDEEVERVLYGLGKPSTLAEEYR